jgi:arylsulfate sulfotransferase
MKNKLAILFVFSSLLVISGCGAAPDNLNVTVSLAPNSVAIAPGEIVQFTAKASAGKTIQWFVNGIPNGNTLFGTIDSEGNYTAPAHTSGMTVSVTASSQSRPPAEAFATVHILPFGLVAATQHPQVASYTISLPSAGEAFVEFGQDTSYGLKTSSQTSSALGGPVSVLVAGMRGFTQYHMRGTVQFPDGARFVDRDQVFTTGGLQGIDLPNVTAQTTPGMTPQSGIELINGVVSQAVPVYATDLDGNVIWWYRFADGTVFDQVDPIQPLANGNFLVTIGPNSDTPIRTAPPPGTINVLREIDLAGNTVRELSVSDLNARLTAAGFNLNIATIHHDVLPQPNGHWIVLTNHVRQFSNLTGFTGPVDVLGDDIVDLDESLQPVWTWSTFDHLDVNRQPMLFPDWTHGNALTYLQEDGNLLLSMRHQHWIIKIDYNNGKGTGDVLWRLGKDGDFTLIGGTDPTDWFYAQHGPNVVGTVSPEVFSLSVMDNGVNRTFPAGQKCQSTGAPNCPYSSGSVYQLDENAKTATLVLHYVPPQFSFFGGYSKQLNNGNLEFDFCAAVLVPPGAAVYEVTPDASPRVVWQMNISNQFAYRAFRLPSLYPGVQW